MQKFVACANIERFRRLIAEYSEGPDREYLERLLAEEEEKLRTYEARPAPAISQDQVIGHFNHAR